MIAIPRRLAPPMTIAPVRSLSSAEVGGLSSAYAPVSDGVFSLVMMLHHELASKLKLIG